MRRSTFRVEHFSAATAVFAHTAALVFAFLAGTTTASAGEPFGVRIMVHTPKNGEVVRSRVDLAPLGGSAVAGERPSSFDVLLVLDVSGSTKYPSGVDVDEDGEVGETRSSLVPGVPDTPNSDPDDSVLAAEIQACYALLSGLDAARVRVGLVSFAGEIDPKTLMRRSPDQKDAHVEQPLTSDFSKVRQALEAVLLRGASGGTDMSREATDWA